MNYRNSLAARLKDRVMLQTCSLAPDGAGGFTENWQDFKEVWAEVALTSGGEVQAFEKSLVVKRYKITLRYINGLDEAMRIIFNGKVLNVFSVSNVENKNRMLEISAAEGV